MIDNGKYKDIEPDFNTNQPGTFQQVDAFLTNFKGANRLQRGGGWQLAGGGSNTSTFLATQVSYSIAPTVNNTYNLGSSGSKWADVYTVKINGVTPRAGTVTFYVSTTNGGATDEAIIFDTGVLT